ncbi:TetR family transcriptional regulator [Streptomyces qinzhouensis]|uniref:TetR/AcrR family transcriptional regulator n=1 Tax=Streptomyces qinzhouensis TaxID=2599401 RepID=A0A5B8J9M1_9ACTN|nr:TetR family transcriptional regulator [Streptomyces qinzhouensis]QDY78006.1 TetR/AcrR family transcriptional regulator [Streptomyces qinzhouensis]
MPALNGPDSSGLPDAPDSTRERIVDAAAAEFSRYGIAGARMDRIAKQARTSKERVYAHFRGKEALYAFVVTRELAAITEATRMDPADLPGYAGRLFDHFTEHPEHFRMIAWGRLEMSEAAAGEPTRAAGARKTEQLRHAQAAGHLDPAWDPVDVLALVGQIATTWTAQTEMADVATRHARDTTLAARRTAVIEAVERIFPTAHPTPEVT